jgi:hypothetical protein
MKNKLTACCKSMERALQDGTDGEGYESLFWWSNDEEILGGSHQEPLVYCPWCGKKIAKIVR